MAEINLEKSFKEVTENNLMEIQLWEHKAEQVNVFLIISTLVFGFSVTLVFEYDENLFLNKEIESILFICGLTICIITSLWSTIGTTGALVMARKYMHRNQSNIVRKVFEKTNPLRVRSEWYCYISFLSLMFSLIIYGFVKLDKINNNNIPLIFNTIILSCGTIGIIVIFIELKKIYLFFDKIDGFDQQNVNKNDADDQRTQTTTAENEMM